MTKYFGTDGIRGKANETLTADRAFQVGRYLGYYYSKEGKKKIVIGKDTRLSSDMLEMLWQLVLLHKDVMHILLDTVQHQQSAI